VFHELARHLQTRRLIAGDSLSLDQDKSFYCVVEGTVQVFAQTDHSPGDQQGLWDDEDMNGYQLLNEVGSGGTLSSLFTILSLFTENVQMSWQDEYPHGIHAFDEEMPTLHRRTRRADSDVSQLDLLNTKSNRRHTPRRSSSSSTTSTVRSPGDSPTASPGSPPIMVGCPPTPRSRFSRQIHQGVVARATVDSTLAVIPAEAFRRLTKKFPKASSHIVQGILNSLYHIDSYSSLLVILTRFSRVTFNAAHEYLGLTSEVLRTEKAINDIACHPLPVSFYEGGGLQHLRQRFDGAASTTSGSSSDYFSFTRSSSRSPMTPLSKAKESSLNISVPSRPSIYQTRSQAVFVNSPRQTVQAGDLLVAKDNMNDGFHSLSRTLSIHGTPRVAQSSSNKEDRKKSLGRWSVDDFDLREEVMSCIAKSIGLLQPPLSGSDSVEASPAIPSTDFRSSSVTSFSSPFSSLSLLDVGDDLSSMTGSSSAASSGNYMSGLNNEVEILFYPAGTILAKAGEMNTGARPPESLSRLSLTSTRSVLCH